MSNMSGLKNKKEERMKKPQQVDGREIDERFSAALNRPQFARVKEKSNKVVLDDRFASVLTDPRFHLQEKDKYGRKKKKKNAIDATNELEAFYTVEREEKEEYNDSDENEAATVYTENQKETEENSDDEAGDPASRIAYLTALSRGEVDVSSSSDDDAASEDESDLDSDSDEDPVSGKAGILDPSNKEEDEVSITEIASPFMAVMNMDWSHVRAVDLFAILSSFTPPGSVKKVQVYPSDFGMKQMAKELTEGPVDIWKREKSQSDDDDDETSENEESGSDHEANRIDMEIGTGDNDFDPEKLRAYEASKLKYYFAVVEFTSAAVADMAYKEVDGLELEHSSAAMDMRCIDPEQLSGVIEGRKVRDEANSLPSQYDPPEFVVSALQQTSVHCTWEDGDTDRERKLTRYGQQTEWGVMAEGEDLAAYLDNSSVGSGDESSDEDDENGEEKKGSKLRKMLGLDSDDEESSSDDDDDTEGDGEKTATFVPGKKTLEEKIRTKLESKEVVELTPWEKYQEKRKQKRREKRQATRSKRGTKTVSSEDDGMYGEDPEFGQAEFEDR
jgi:hypothetical protein